MNERNIILEVETLLSEAKSLINKGLFEQATVKISDAEDKLRPIGSGTNGPEPKE